MSCDHMDQTMLEIKLDFTKLENLQRDGYQCMTCDETDKVPFKYCLTIHILNFFNKCFNEYPFYK